MDALRAHVAELEAAHSEVCSELSKLVSCSLIIYFIVYFYA